jgi:hypothetical protein
MRRSAIRRATGSRSTRCPTGERSVHLRVSEPVGRPDEVTTDQDDEGRGDAWSGALRPHRQGSPTGPRYIMFTMSS